MGTSGEGGTRGLLEDLERMVAEPAMRVISNGPFTAVQARDWVRDCIDRGRSIGAPFCRASVRNDGGSERTWLVECWDDPPLPLPEPLFEAPDDPFYDAGEDDDEPEVDPEDL